LSVIQVTAKTFGNFAVDVLAPSVDVD